MATKSGRGEAKALENCTGRNEIARQSTKLTPTRKVERGRDFKANEVGRKIGRAREQVRIAHDDYYI